MTDAQGTEDFEAGRAVVRKHLIERLHAAGMVKPRKLGAEAFAQSQKFLERQLAYMSADNVMTLAETLIDNAVGSEWPSEVVIRAMAKDLQKPPVTQSRLMSSWLASVEGPKAVAAGYLVELYRYLRRHNKPPAAFDLRRIAEEADANQRHATIVRERIEADIARPEDRHWLVQYQADREAALAIVDHGNKKRAEGDAA